MPQLTVRPANLIYAPRITLCGECGNQLHEGDRPLYINSSYGHPKCMLDKIGKAIAKYYPELCQDG